MSLDPLLNASPVIQIHAFMAFFAVALTIAIFTRPKGSRYHRVLGWSWVISMGLVAISSFWISDMPWVGPFGPIHLISLFTLFSLVKGVLAARGHRVAQHRQTMRALVFGALIVAGAFTILPGRIMFQVVTGG